MTNKDTTLMDPFTIERAVQYLGRVRIDVDSIMVKFRHNSPDEEPTLTPPDWLGWAGIECLPEHLKAQGARILLDKINQGLLPYTQPNSINPCFAKSGDWLVLGRHTPVHGWQEGNLRVHRMDDETFRKVLATGQLAADMDED